MLFVSGPQGITQHRYDALVSTVPLDQLLRCLQDRPALTALAPQLRYSSTHVIGIGLAGSPPPQLQGKSWVYFPEPDQPFYRATVFSNYSPRNAPRGCWSLMAEASESPSRPVDHGTIVQDSIEAFRACGLIPRRAVVLSYYHRRVEHGYPTPFVGRDKLLDQVQPELRDDDILSRGRFGGWKYEASNMDHSLMQGVEAADAILHGTEETTYFFPAVVNSRRSAARVCGVLRAAWRRTCRQRCLPGHE